MSNTRSSRARLLRLAWGGLLCLLGAGCSSTEQLIEDFVFATEPASGFARVNRMGMPCVNMFLISSKDAYNQGHPGEDLAGRYQAEIQTAVTTWHGALDDDLAQAQLAPATVDQAIRQTETLVIPDTLRVDLDQPAGFPNGRGPADPVMDLMLGFILLDVRSRAVDTLAKLPLNPPANDVAFSNTFPYLAAPHRP